MTIIEAIRSLSKGTGSCITRKAWDYPRELVGSKLEPGIKLLPTNSPNGVMVLSCEGRYQRWHPLAGDLIADDWLVVW